MPNYPKSGANTSFSEKSFFRGVWCSLSLISLIHSSVYPHLLLPLSFPPDVPLSSSVTSNSLDQPAISHLGLCFPYHVTPIRPLWNSVLSWFRCCPPLMFPFPTLVLLCYILFTGLRPLKWWAPPGEGSHLLLWLYWPLLGWESHRVNSSLQRRASPRAALGTSPPPVPAGISDSPRPACTHSLPRLFLS